MTRDTYTVAGVTYCSACGCPDCPNASAKPFFQACPARTRAELLARHAPTIKEETDQP
jgi:hypothetical protein